MSLTERKTECCGHYIPGWLKVCPICKSEHPWGYKEPKLNKRPIHPPIKTKGTLRDGTTWEIPPLPFD